MAAGEGRRLRPLTERWPKPVLPVDGRPVLATLLRELAAAGIEDAWIVVGHLAGQVEALAGDGAGFGLRVRYAHQPEPLGSADAVSRAVAAGAQAPLLVSAADTVYTAGDLGAAAARWQEAGTGLGLGVRLGEDPRPEHTRVRVEDGRVTALGEGDATAAPLWFFGAEAVAALEDVPGPPYALATVLERTFAAGGEVTALPLGPTRDLTRPADLVRENFPYLWERTEGRGIDERIRDVRPVQAGPGADEEGHERPGDGRAREGEAP